MAPLERACVVLQQKAESNLGSECGPWDACVVLPIGGGARLAGVMGRGLEGACAKAVGGRPDSPLFRFAILRGSGSGGGGGGWSL